MTRIPDAPRRRLLAWALHRHIEARPPDFVVDHDNEAYLCRWFVVRGGRRWLGIDPQERLAILARDNPREDDRRHGAFNVYLHRFWSSDHDVPHDHPWRSATVVLDGGYLEHIPIDPRRQHGPCRVFKRTAGDIVLRPRPRRAHRVEIVSAPATTLFLTGPRMREWGFYQSTGWVPWREFLDRGGE